jgi:hypothetical protein
MLWILVGCDLASRPSESDVRQLCSSHLGGDFSTDPKDITITLIEFGNSIVSQGGMMELAMDAPKGVTIFPVKVHFAYRSDPEKGWFKRCWVFKDSFGQWKCIPAP